MAKPLEENFGQGLERQAHNEAVKALLALKKQIVFFVGSEGKKFLFEPLTDLTFYPSGAILLGTGEHAKEGRDFVTVDEVCGAFILTAGCACIVGGVDDTIVA